MTEKSPVSSIKRKGAKDSALVSDLPETGLTDDERVVREDEFLGDEPRVEPGPADLERLKKTKFSSGTRRDQLFDTTSIGR